MVLVSHYARPGDWHHPGRGTRSCRSLYVPPTYRSVSHSQFGLLLDLIGSPPIQIKSLPVSRRGRDNNHSLALALAGFYSDFLLVAQ